MAVFSELLNSFMGWLVIGVVVFMLVMMTSYSACLLASLQNTTNKNSRLILLIGLGVILITRPVYISAGKQRY